MKCRYTIYSIVASFIHLTCWYFVMGFCGTYINSNYGWLYGSLISLGIDFFLVKPGLALLKAILRLLAQRFPRTCFVKIYTWAVKILSFF